MGIICWLGIHLELVIIVMNYKICVRTGVSVAG